MKRLPVLSLVVMTMSLAGCGGGGGGGEAVASIPPPPPPPAPQQSPPPPLSSPVTPTQSSTGLAAVAVDGVASVIAGPDKVVVGRDASGGYVITLPFELPLTGVTKEMFSANTAIQPDRFVVSRSGAGGRTEELRIYKGGVNYGLTMQYVSFGELFSCDLPNSCEQGAGIDSSTKRAFFVFGDLTPLSDIPLSGMASYSGGLAAHPGIGSIIEGDVSLTVNFASKDVAGAFSNMGYWADGGIGGANFESLPGYGLSGKIDGAGTLSGIITSGDAAPQQAGQWQARYFGPGAKEIGGAFLINSIANFPAKPVDGVFGLTKN